MKLTILALAALALTSPLISRAAQPTRPRPGIAAAPSTAIKNVFWQPNTLQQGSAAFFTVELEHPAVRVTAVWIGKTLNLFKTDNPKIWYALGGADLETQPGTYDLQVTASLPGGRISRASKKIDIAAATFTNGDIKVPDNFVEPDAASLRQIASDELAKSRAYSHFLNSPEWSGNFKPPVTAKPTPSFGESRILNEEKSSLHRGTDYPVPDGTPVQASNSGTVVLAKELFYEGNCVIIDHGQRLFTIYMHLSKINVSVGDKVEKGTRLGLSGRTGRVTGPHLHMGVRWSGAYLDPTKLLALTLPAIPENDHR